LFLSLLNDAFSTAEVYITFNDRVFVKADVGNMCNWGCRCLFCPELLVAYLVIESDYQLPNYTQL
jgi:hypothetical protein